MINSKFELKQSISNSVLGMQNKLNVEDFKEDKINEQLQMFNRSTMSKIDSLKAEMEFIVAQQSPKMDETVHEELKSLEEELKNIEGFVLIQQFDMDRINQKNKNAVSELKMTDFKLQDKLTNVEKNVRRIGTDILVRTKMLTPNLFKFWKNLTTQSWTEKTYNYCGKRL